MPQNTVQLTTSDISITADGRVVIKNNAFAKALVQDLVAKNPDLVGFFDNCNCKRSEAVRMVDLAEAIPNRKISFDSILPPEVGIFDNCSCT